MAKLLTRSQILKTTQGYRTEELYVSAWEGTVLVRELTAQEVGELGTLAENVRAADPSSGVMLSEIVSFFPVIAAWVVVDEQLESILTADDVRAMTGSNLVVIRPIVELAFKLSELESLQAQPDGEDEKPDPNG